MKKRLFLSLLLAGFLFLSSPAREAAAQPFEPSFDEGMAAFNYGDNDLAAKHFARLASDGDSRAQYYLAYMMDSGLGMGKDVGGAALWYEKSAKQDYLPAIVYMGYINSVGHGVPRDEKMAFKYYTKAAQMGDPIAQNNLASMLRLGRPYAQDNLLAAEWFLQSAMQGNMRAQFNLATMYRLGEGIKKNFREAVKWYTYAASQGDMYAQNALGYMYYRGLGVDQADTKANRQIALEWYRRAAEQGHIPSQLAVAHMYEMGDAPDKGIDDALIWYMDAANKGNNVSAMLRLGKLYDESVKSHDTEPVKPGSIKPDNREAMKWYRKAAEETATSDQADKTAAMDALAHLYTLGVGTRTGKPDYKTAVQWYKKASDVGDYHAMMELAGMYEAGVAPSINNLSGTGVDLKQAYYYYKLASKVVDKEKDVDSFAEAFRKSTEIGIKLPQADKNAADFEAESRRPANVSVYRLTPKQEQNKAFNYDQ